VRVCVRARVCHAVCVRVCASVYAGKRPNNSYSKHVLFSTNLGVYELLRQLFYVLIYQTNSNVGVYELLRRLN
jgi:hypothetical protein